MNSSYAFNSSVNVIFGRGKRFELHDRLADFDKKLVVCGRHFIESQDFKELFHGRKDCLIYTALSKEPTLAMVEDALKFARREQVDSIVAIGGGSVIDFGKSIAALYEQTDSVRDYFYCRSEFSGKRLFFCALPTSAGTGAEVTPNSVLTDESNMIKQSLRGRTCGVDLAIVDPELTYSCPLGVVRHSGMDSLTQAIEGAVSKKANNLTFALSMQAFKLVFDNLQQACDGDCFAKDAVAEGTMIGAMAFVHSGLGAVHGLAHPIGSLYHIPHGLICGILLVHILKINRLHLNAAAVSYYGPAGTADMLINDISTLADKLEIPRDLKGILQKKDFDFIVKNCRSGSMKCNPVDLSDEDIIKLLESLA